ncbi:hypothetical protein ACH4TM_12320 [Streptomyces parvus]|uniref:hypothetical protein n=1 Tax=Streptomyces parvus TaxID=66428 RepID=UPI003325FE64
MPELEQVLKEWNDNWGRAMPGYVVEFYTLTSDLGDERRILWTPILDDLREDERLYNLIASGIGWTETPAA